MCQYQVFVISTKRKDASEISYDDSFTGMIAPTVQDAIERLDVTRNYIAAGALEHPAHTVAVDASSVSMDSADYNIFTGGKFVKRNIPGCHSFATNRRHNQITSLYAPLI